MATKIWSVGAGKGGVGKTFTVSSLGITLSKLNHNVLLLDLDLSGANLHSTFGLPLTQNNLRKFVSGEKSIKELITLTGIPRVSYVQGFWDNWTPSELNERMITELFSQVRELPFDFVIVDLGAGPSPTYLEVFKRSDERILIGNSEPTTVEKTYRFIETYVCSTLKERVSSEQYLALEKALRDYRWNQGKGYFSFRNFLKTQIGSDLNYSQVFEERPIHFIVNSSRSRLDQDLGFSMKSVCTKYYDFPLNYLGPIDFDNAVWQAVRNCEPVLIEKPFTPIAGQFLSIVKTMTHTNFHSNLYKAVI
ncbi:MAG: P-loop NTPase [Proteobacteria bacterium]|jgi:flagellar biosynthesis protein FlhG|nr:P-loop NTPase [Pseudomonadota bacterium]